MAHRKGNRGFFCTLNFNLDLECVQNVKDVPTVTDFCESHIELMTRARASRLSYLNNSPPQFSFILFLSPGTFFYVLFSCRLTLSTTTATFTTIHTYAFLSPGLFFRLHHPSHSLHNQTPSSTKRPSNTMSVFISSFNSDAPIKTYNIPGTATLKLKLPAYNKHRDGSWPTTDSQRAYIQHQRALYNNNLIRLYYAFQATMRQRIAELGGNASQAMAETSAEVQAQAQHLYYDRVWNKSNAGGKKLDSLLYRGRQAPDRISGGAWH